MEVLNYRSSTILSGAVIAGVCLLTALAVIGGCSRYRSVSKAPARDNGEQNERVFKTNQEAVEAGIYEEFTDSMALKGETPSAASVSRDRDREQAEAPSQPATIPPVESGPGEVPDNVAMGFRVQLGAFQDLEHAEELAARVRRRFGDRYPIYVRYYAPLWKVQAGDCPTRQEAESLQAVMRRNGYPDAWVARTGIKK